jgi:hypothetical protein
MWTGISTFASNLVGDTYCVPLYNSTNQFNGAIGFDFLLGTVQDSFRSFSIPGVVSYIVETIPASYYMVATSIGEPVTLTSPSGAVSPKPVTSAVNFMIKESWSCLTLLGSQATDGYHQYISASDGQVLI